MGAMLCGLLCSIFSGFCAIVMGADGTSGIRIRNHLGLDRVLHPVDY